MGPHGYRKANVWSASHLPPIVILAILGGFDTLVVCLATAPWLFQSFVVYVDDEPVRTSQREPLVNFRVPGGRHQIFIELGWLRSEKVAVDLACGEQAQLVCGTRALVRNRLFRFFELKMMFVAMPVAIAAFYIPSVMRVVERHFAAEFLAIICISQLGFLLSLPRYFSRKPGAMIYLMEQTTRSERLL